MRTQKANNTPAPRAKALPAMALRGTLTVLADGRIIVTVNGKHVEVVEVAEESVRETLRSLARHHFGTGGVLRRSMQSKPGCVFYLAFR